MEKRKISIIMPIVRPDSAEGAIEAALNGCGDPQVITSFGDVNPTYMTDTAIVEVVTEEDEQRIGCPRMVKRLVEKASSDIVVFLGDDTEAKDGWLAEALAQLDTCPEGVGVVGLHTQPGDDRQHWLAHKGMLQYLDGEFFHTGYRHNFCDDELKDRANDLGRFRYAENAVILHRHPVDGETPMDDDYRAINDYGQFMKDQRLYWRRKKDRNGFKLAVGFPLVDDNVPAQFFISYACMDKPSEYMLLVPTYPHGSFPRSISAARNSLVFQALDHGCSHILMMDTDQVYPPHTFIQLLKHDVDVCGVRVHRRWPPFDVIMMRGTLGNFKHVPDDECFSGNLVPVDATGTGCLLINTDVFIKLDSPWFMESQTPNGQPVGEDIYFCAQARQAGFEIYVDTSIEVGHLALREIGRGDYELFKKLNKMEWKT